MSILPVARRGDRTIGFCKIHGFRSGKIVTGRQDIKINHSIDASVGDTVRATCGHTGTIITGNQAVLDNVLLPSARLTDRFVGVYSGYIIQGSKDTFA